MFVQEFLVLGACFSMLSFLCLRHYLHVCFSIVQGSICMLDCLLSDSVCVRTTRIRCGALLASFLIVCVTVHSVIAPRPHPLALPVIAD